MADRLSESEKFVNVSLSTSSSFCETPRNSFSPSEETLLDIINYENMNFNGSSFVILIKLFSAQSNERTRSGQTSMNSRSDDPADCQFELDSLDTRPVQEVKMDVRKRDETSFD